MPGLAGRIALQHGLFMLPSSSSLVRNASAENAGHIAPASTRPAVVLRAGRGAWWGLGMAIVCKGPPASSLGA